jgi:hypothetical protein
MYDGPPTCFIQYTAIIREAVYKEIYIQQILSFISVFFVYILTDGGLVKAETCTSWEPRHTKQIYLLFIVQIVGLNIVCSVYCTEYELHYNRYSTLQ